MKTNSHKSRSLTTPRGKGSVYLLLLIFLGECLIVSFAATYPAYNPNPINPQNYYIKLEQDGLISPTNFAFAPDGRIFITEKRGTVRVKGPDGTLSPDYWIDLQDEVQDAGDRGLLSIALHPTWPALKYVYLLYVKDPIYGQPDEPAEMAAYGKLVRYEEGPDGKALPGSEFIILGKTPIDGTPCCHSSHTVGTVTFGLDGTLLVSSGDGAHWDTLMDDGTDFNQYDPGCAAMFGADQDVGAFRSQQLNSLGGKILRLNPANGEGIGPGNPLGANPNPFWNGNPTSPQSRIWATGLRNQFRVKVRTDNAGPGPNPGTLYVGDVGWQRFEELNVVTQGGMNFGWPCFQGPVADQDYNNPAITAKITQLCAPLVANPPYEALNPFLTWHHGEPTPNGINIGYTGNAASGAVPYTGTNYADFVGTPANRAVFFADYGQQWVKVCWVNDQDQLQMDKPVQAFMNVGPIVALHANPVTGDLWFATIDGQLRSIQSTSAPPPTQGPDLGTPPAVFASASVTAGSAPLTVQFTSDGTFDPDRQNLLLFEWDFGDNSSVSNDPNPRHTYRVKGQYEAKLTVTDVNYLQDSYTVHIVADNTPPAVRITYPPNDYKFKDNEEVTFTAEVTDPDTPEEELEWRWEIRIVHNNHQHPDTFVTANHTFTSVLSTFISPIERNSLEIHLVVKDSTGVSGEHWIRAEPIAAENTAPQAVFEVEPQDGAAMLTVKVEAAKSTDAEMDWLYYEWDFGDRTVGSGRETSHTYAKPGLYTIKLLITDPWGATDTTTQDVNVGKPQDYLDLDASPHLLVHYDMDALLPNDTLKDSSKYVGHDGQVLGAVLPMGEGVMNQSMVFDGNQVVVVPFGGISVTGNVTVSLWMNVKPGNDAYMRLVSTKNAWDGPQGFEVVYNPAQGTLDLLGSGGNFLRGQLVADGQWHHVVAIAKGIVGLLMVDGRTLVSGVIDPIAPNDPPRDLYLGSYGVVFPDDTAFIGSMDEVRIYDAALAPMQALELYREVRPQTPEETTTNTGSQGTDTSISSPTDEPLKTQEHVFSAATSPASYGIYVYSVLIGLFLSLVGYFYRA